MLKLSFTVVRYYFMTSSAYVPTIESGYRLSLRKKFVCVRSYNNIVNSNNQLPSADCKCSMTVLKKSSVSI